MQVVFRLLPDLDVRFHRLPLRTNSAGWREDEIPTAEALARAQRQIRETRKWSHPRYWAAWVLWGLSD